MIPKFNLSSIQTKYKILGTIGLVALTFGFYYDNLYKPHANIVSQLNADIMNLEDTIKIVKNLEYPNIKDNHLILEKIRQCNEQTLKQISASETILPKRSDFTLILERITQIAHQLELEIKTMEPKEVVKNDVYESIPLDLEITTRFGNFLFFLEQLKNTPAYIERIQMELKDRPLLTIRLNMFIYVK